MIVAINSRTMSFLMSVASQLLKQNPNKNYLCLAMLCCVPCFLPYSAHLEVHPQRSPQMANDREHLSHHEHAPTIIRFAKATRVSARARAGAHVHASQHFPEGANEGIRREWKAQKASSTSCLHPIPEGMCQEETIKRCNA